MRISCFIGAAIAALSPSIATANDAARVRALINEEGHRCDAVANMRNPVLVDNGDVMFVADCAGGESHVIRLIDGERPEYYMRCKAMLNPIRC